MEYQIGALLALGVCLFVTLLGLDRDRAVYPAMAIVVASYNGLFALTGNTPDVLLHELPGIAAFVLLAAVGFRINLWYAVAALAGHGVFDGFHGQLIANPGVPEWWPGFCLSFDVVAAIWLAGALLGSRVAARPVHPRPPEPDFSRRIRPHVDSELALARTCMAGHDFATAFRHLERAHVLGQRSTREHVRVHSEMLRWALNQRRLREAGAQVFRIAGAALLTAIGLVPEGNTGGGNVSAFRRMPIARDLAEITAAARAVTPP